MQTAKQHMFRMLLIPALLVVSTQAWALTIHYSNTRSDALKLCDQLLYRGDKQASMSCYQEVYDASTGLEQADAAASLGDIGKANKLYRNAASESDDPTIKTHWGHLYLQTHQVSDAEALFREALLTDESYLPAQIGLAEAMAEGFESRARELLQQITSANPDNVHALLLLARIELELQNLDVGRGLLNRALAEIEEQQLPPLEIYALHAGADLLEDKPLKPWIERALAFNPNYGAVYSIPAHFYIITYRYREAIDLYHKAVTTDPDLAVAHRDLGINQLRVNQIFAARYHLQRAYELDPYDIQTVNTLRLLDGIDDMRISAVDVPDPDNPDKTLGRVLIRLDREDADALEPYVIDLSIKAVQVFTDRYDFTLRKPMVVELYHDHDDFGVRTVSTPGIGLLGVTFGYLTAMDSPKARADGEFHWGSTLWHEIAHVFTLSATNHRLPRWFSEGLSVYEEWNTGPLKDRELSLEMLTAMKSNQLLPLADLDQGFVRPSYNGQVQVSYMQAGLICDFIAERWGHEALLSMLKSYADRQSTEAAVEQAIGISSRKLDEEFNQHLIARFGDLIDNLDNYTAEARQLERALQFEDWVSVEALARDLIRRYPERIGPGNAYEILAAAQRKQGEEAQATDTLLAWHAQGGHRPDTLLDLIGTLREQDRLAESVPVMESLNWVSPYHQEIHQWLGEHYLAVNDAPRAVREFNALLGMEIEDLADAHLGLAKAALQMDDTSLARRQVLYALEQAPFYRPAQRLLLALTAGE